ncbi:MAG: hypothetical protein ABR572_04865 [Cryomorphaceae bacterium]|nr:hypothetical protein [Flavobacteriales bacterium]
MYRQGDVLIERIANLPQAPLTTERLLVRGEGRNHGHFMTGEAVEITKADDDTFTEGGGIVTHYLNVHESCTLEHLLIDSTEWTGEHAAIEIPPGTYRVIRQREFDPYAKAIRAVKD